MVQAKETLSNLAKIQSGSPQFRIKESNDASAIKYTMYDQNHLNADIEYDKYFKQLISKIVQTYDEVKVTKEGDLIFSLISGQASIISKRYVGLLVTQNYLIIQPNDNLKKEYLQFLLNEHKDIKKQVQILAQGSSVMKYTAEMVKKLRLSLPSIEKQIIVGDTYTNLQRLESRKKRRRLLRRKIILSELME